MKYSETYFLCWLLVGIKVVTEEFCLKMRKPFNSEKNDILYVSQQMAFKILNNFLTDSVALPKNRKMTIVFKIYLTVKIKTMQKRCKTLN